MKRRLFELRSFEIELLNVEDEFIPPASLDADRIEIPDVDRIGIVIGRIAHEIDVPFNRFRRMPMLVSMPRVIVRIVGQVDVRAGRRGFAVGHLGVAARDRGELREQ